MESLAPAKGSHHTDIRWWGGTCDKDRTQVMEPKPWHAGYPLRYCWNVDQGLQHIAESEQGLVGEWLEWCLHHRVRVVQGLGRSGPPHSHVSLRALANARKIQCAFHRESKRACKTPCKTVRRILLLALHLIKQTTHTHHHSSSTTHLTSKCLIGAAACAPVYPHPRITSPWAHC